MNKVIKLLLLLSFFIVGGYFFTQHDGSSRKMDSLPWVINADDPVSTQVFGVNIGKSTLTDLSHVVGKLPELAIFQSKTGERTLEAYFSRVRLGVLKASVVAVLDVDDKQLSTFADFESAGKPMPSGLRKHILSRSGLQASGVLRVWKLVYMPAVNYSEQQLLQFFGTPKKRTIVSNQSQYWHYPDKALLIAYDTEAKEIFYYTAKKDYRRLLNNLLDKLDKIDEK